MGRRSFGYPRPAPDEPADADVLRVLLARPGALASVGDARAAIDAIDAALAVLLERRAEIAVVVQRLKPVGGFAGRSAEREAQIVAAMAARAPALGAARLARVMDAVIEAGLEVAEERRSAGA
ncbi:chorismate mutase [Actinomadura parmotrematis]|uniref:Chorismate mutase n=1 Tax=Actinomadura parmotrematis TaxID=2864039 RepID=A0ABS7FKZ6_9ACTN|nr:chorismate mutase [Actinomadura parmotrematis]MBW8481036.1 chorismate mutase [Actinomadura parmotrematis]